jgi:hypothetical protein
VLKKLMGRLGAKTGKKGKTSKTNGRYHSTLLGDEYCVKLKISFPFSTYVKIGDTIFLIREIFVKKKTP